MVASRAEGAVPDDAALLLEQRNESLGKWGFLAAIGLIDLIWLAAGGYRFDFPSATAPPVWSGILIAAAWTCRSLGRNPGLFALFDTVAQFVLLASLGGVLSYLVLTTDMPLVDRHLAAFDAALGFDWPRFVLWVESRPGLDLTLQVAYALWVPEWLIVPILLAYRSEAQLRELSGSIMISIVVVYVVSALFPAVNAYWYFASSHPPLVREIDFHDIFGLRDGSLRTISLKGMEGLVSLPSFHAIVALLFVYALRGRGVLFASGLAFNSLVIVSALSAGGHYLSDLLAAVPVALFSVVCYRLLRRRALPFAAFTEKPSDAAPAPR
jgi:membrane-associated phospholipid phosphatase